MSNSEKKRKKREKGERREREEKRKHENLIIFIITTIVLHLECANPSLSLH